MERSPRDPRDPLDEEAAWAEIVAGYGAEPAFPTPDDEPVANTAEAPGAKAPEADPGAKGKPGEQDAVDPLEKPGADDRPRSEPSVGSFVVYAPGVGPRDWQAAEASDDDFDESDEGHFSPPDPPLPKADTTTKFAWIAVLGGPLLLVLMIILRQPITWWITLLGIGGFLGGFATLIARMKHDDEDDGGLPGGGAVV